MSKLTEDEREKLIHHIGAWRWESRGLARCEEHFIAEVEAIITARLARVEALVAPVEGLECPPALFDAMYGQATDPDGVLGLSVIAAANAIRAALAAAPSREEKPCNGDLHFHPCKTSHEENAMPEPTTTNTRFYLPPKSPDARPEDVVGRVRHYADLAGVEPTDADYARMGYWEAVGRMSDARVMAGSSAVGQEATWAYRAACPTPCMTYNHPGREHEHWLASIWDGAIDAAFRGAITRENAADVKRHNPYSAAPSREAGPDSWEWLGTDR